MDEKGMLESIPFVANVPPIAPAKNPVRLKIQLLIQIGKGLKLSLPFPPVHTVRATFIAYGVPTNPIHSILCI